MSSLLFRMKEVLVFIVIQSIVLQCGHMWAPEDKCTVILYSLSYLESPELFPIDNETWGYFNSLNSSSKNLD